MVGEGRGTSKKQRAVHLDLAPPQSFLMTGIQVIGRLPAEAQRRHADAYYDRDGEAFFDCEY